MNRYLIAAFAGLFGLATLIPLAAKAGKTDDTLNIAWDRELKNIDFYFTGAREGIIVNRLVWDTLLWRDPDSGEFKPLLAQSYKMIDDTTFEFVIRQGVSFHNGAPMRPEDVVYTMKFLIRPDTGKIADQTVKWIKDAEIVGPNTVRIYAKEPQPLALLYLAGSIPIYPEAYYEKVGPAGMGLKPVGTGPYKVLEVEPGKKIVFQKNDAYFAGSPKGKPSIGKIVQRTLPDVNTQIAELISGELDWIYKVTADQAEKLAQMPAVDVLNASTMRIGYLQFDVAGRSGKNPFQDIRVRRAVAHGIDRQSIVDNVVKGKSVVVNSACYPGQFGCTQEVVKYDFDAAKAKRLLAEAGYPNGFKIKLCAYRDRPYLEAIVGYLTAMGIKTELCYGKYAETRDAIRGNEVPFAFMTWGSGSVPDVDAIAPLFFGGNPDDLAQDKDVQGWLKAGGSTVDPGKRKVFYDKAFKRIAEQIYWVPLWTWNTNYAMSKDLDWTPTADEIPRFFTAKWK